MGIHKLIPNLVPTKIDNKKHVREKSCFHHTPISVFHLSRSLWFITYQDLYDSTQTKQKILLRSVLMSFRNLKSSIFTCGTQVLKHILVPPPPSSVLTLCVRRN